MPPDLLDDFLLAAAADAELQRRTRAVLVEVGEWLEHCRAARSAGLLYAVQLGPWMGGHEQGRVCARALEHYSPHPHLPLQARPPASPPPLKPRWPTTCSTQTRATGEHGSGLG